MTTPSPSTQVKRHLKTRHLSMIAIGGCIGTGLFMASGTAIHSAGPGGALVAYAAIGLMVSGHRLGRRIRWMAGAGLMGVVVLKLFTVELGGSGGIARIVSFIGVGLLLLLVGWFAPVPPREGED